MPSPLDAYTQPLTAQTAAHLLRRATFGPTQAEITAFTNLTAQQAVTHLINNANYGAPPPVDADETKPTAGRPFLTLPYDDTRNFALGQYVRYWWLALMTQQTTPPSLLDKLALFWQNHFVTTRSEVQDHRFVFRYIQLIRANALGNFRTFVTAVTKDPAMLRFLNGDENEVGKPNENYARELQELFTVGAVDAGGNKNYTEDDVKNAARVLTGWGHTNFKKAGSTSFDTTFNSIRHDSADKQFSVHYNNRVIGGRSNSTAGDAELAELVNMLLAHPQCPRFICRKLYRWFVNPNVTDEVETNVIEPLAAFFAGPANDFAIRPVVEKLLTSQAFFDPANRAAMVKSPADLVVGSMRFFNQPVPDSSSEVSAFRKYFDFVFYRMSDMQMELVEQPTVFGYDAYYQPGLSKLWINTTTLGLRGNLTDAFVLPWLQIKPGYTMGIDLLTWARNLQPNFSDVTGTAAISCTDVLAGLTRNLFAHDLQPAQQNFLIDQIMMQQLPRTSWTFEWNSYRRNPNDGGSRFAVLNRLQNLMKYLLRMAEYHVC